MAKSTVYNADGTTNTQTDTGGGASVATSLIDMGHYWNSSYTAGTAGQMIKTVYNNANQGVGAHPFTFTALRAMTITNLSMFEAGPCNGVHTLELRKNGAASGTTITMGTGTGNVHFTQTVNISLALGDTLLVYAAVNAAGNTQVSAYMTVTI